MLYDLILSMLKKIPNWLKNKYSISLLIFLVLITFFENSLITQHSYRVQLDDLNTEKEYFTKEIERTRRELNELFIMIEKRQV